MKNTSAAPSATATKPAVYAQLAPSRNDWRAALMIWVWYCGYCCAVCAALENDFVSCDCTLSVTSLPFGDPAMSLVNADAYPAVSNAPRIDCMIAPPKSRCRSAVPDAIPARVTGTEPVSECDAGVPASPTPMPMNT